VTKGCLEGGDLIRSCSERRLNKKSKRVGSCEFGTSQKAQKILDSAIGATKIHFNTLAIQVERVVSAKRINITINEGQTGSYQRKNEQGCKDLARKRIARIASHVVSQHQNDLGI